MSKPDSGYRQITIRIPTSWRSFVELLFVNHRLILVGLVSFLIFYSFLFGNLLIFGYPLRMTYLFIAYFILMLAYKVDSRFSVALALVCLGFTAAFVLAKNDKQANWLATGAYTFLAIGVLTQFLELRQESKLLPQPIREEKLPHSHRGRVYTYRRRGKGLVVLISLIVISSVVLGGYWITRNFLYQQAKPKKAVVHRRHQKKSKQARLATKNAQDLQETLEATATASTATIEVLNGNGVKKEGRKVANVLIDAGLAVSSVGDADRHDYLHTLIRYKPGYQQLAERLAKEIEFAYPSSLQSSLPSNSKVAVQVILGWDRTPSLIDKSKLKLEVLNGNNRTGAAARLADQLKKLGYLISKVGNAGGIYSQTEVQFSQNTRIAASLLAEQLDQDYQVVTKENHSLEPDSIVVIVGRK
jgi:hypothetical protein